MGKIKFIPIGKPSQEYLDERHADYLPRYFKVFGIEQQRGKIYNKNIMANSYLNDNLYTIGIMVGHRQCGSGIVPGTQFHLFLNDEFFEINDFLKMDETYKKKLANGTNFRNSMPFHREENKQALKSNPIVKYTYERMKKAFGRDDIDIEFVPGKGWYTMCSAIFTSLDDLIDCSIAEIEECHNEMERYENRHSEERRKKVKFIDDPDFKIFNPKQQPPIVFSAHVGGDTLRTTECVCV